MPYGRVLLRILSVGLLLLAPSTLMAMGNITRYSVEQGLSHNSVTAIVQDAKGFLWVATQDGLNRFDGYRFKPFRHRRGNPHSLADNFVWSLAVGPKNQVWAATRNGLSRYNYDRADFNSWPVSNKQSVVENAITSLWVNDDGTVWIGTWGHGLQRKKNSVAKITAVDRADDLTRRYVNDIQRQGNNLWLASGPHYLRSAGRAGLTRYLLNEQRFINYPPPDKSGVTALRISPMGTLWVATRSGHLWTFDPNSGHYQAGPSLPISDITSLAFDHDKTLWIGTDRGLFYLTAQGRLGQFAASATLGKGPGTRMVSALYVDNTNALWVGTWIEGIYRIALSNNGFTTLNAGAGDHTLPGQQVLSMLVDKDSNLWIANWNKGLVRFNAEGKRTGVFHHRAKDPASLIAGQVRQLATDPQGRIWIGTDNGLSLYLGPHQGFRNYHYNPAQTNSLCGKNVIHLRAGLRSGIWVGTRGGGACYLSTPTAKFKVYRHIHDQPDSLSNNSVSSILVERRGIWFATEGGGLNYLDRATGRFRHFISKAHEARGLSSNLLTALIRDKSGVLWIASQGGGLDRAISGTENTDIVGFSSMTTADGLISDSITGLVLDQQGSLWLASTAGISRMRLKDQQIRNFELNTSFLNGSFYQAKTGRIYFGGQHGMVSFLPQKITLNAHLPPVVLTQLRLANRVVLPSANGPLRTAIETASTLNIPYQEAIFSLKFSALDFNDPGKNQYRYRLLGFDRKWIDADSNNRIAIYTNVPGGRYKFQVIASNNDGLWNNLGRSINIRIASSPWLGSWAISGYVLSFLLVVFYLSWEYRQRQRLRLRYRRELEETEERLKLSLWGSGDEFWDWDMKTGTLHRSNRLQVKALPKKLLNGQIGGLHDFVHPRDLTRLNQAYLAHRSGRDPAYECMYRVRNNSGSWVWVLDRGKIVSWDDNGMPARMCGTMKNINALKDTEEQLKIIAQSLENTADGVWITDAKFRIIFINNAYSRITGRDQTDVIGQIFHFSRIKRQDDVFEQFVLRYLQQQGSWQGEIWDQRIDGEAFPIELNVDSVRTQDQSISHFIGVFSDITHRKRSEEALQRLAKYDRLTGLLNQTQLMRLIERRIGDDESDKTKSFALIFVSMDGFKAVNDNFGLTAGDELLRSIAERLSGSVRPTDHVSRYGGDEFTILITALLKAELLAATLRRIRKNIKRAFLINEHEIHITASMGVAIYPEHGLTATKLFGNVHAATAQLKIRNGDGIQYFNESIHLRAQISNQLDTELRDAIKNDELQLYYLPRIDICNHRIVAVEVLLRWNSPRRGMITPSNFIPIAEQTGLIHPVGEWLLEQLSQTMVRLRNHQTLRFAIHISPVQLRRDNFVADLQRTLNSAEVAESCLEVIVAESLLAQGSAAPRNALELLFRAGCRISMSHLGTTPATLDWLHSEQLDSIRVSRQLTRGIERFAANRALIRAIIELTRSLGIDCTVEGVETQEQLLWLKDNGARLVTGFYFSRPLELDALEQLLEKGFDPALNSD